MESQIPENYQDYGETIISNFDHEIDEEVAKSIKGQPLYAGYAGWDFHGQVWWDNNQWHCEVKVYCVIQEVISADTLPELMEAVSDEYGWG